MPAKPPNDEGIRARLFHRLLRGKRLLHINCNSELIRK